MSDEADAVEVLDSLEGCHECGGSYPSDELEVVYTKSLDGTMTRTQRCFRPKYQERCEARRPFRDSR